MTALLRTIGLGLALFGCTSQAVELDAVPERVDEQMWLEAQRQAHMIDPRLPFRASVPLIIHASRDEICRLWEEPADCSVVATYYREKNVAVFDSAQMWRSSVVAQGFIVHEAAHSQQPDDWPQGCRELHAYTVQSVWYASLGNNNAAEHALETGLHFPCEMGADDGL